MGGDKAVHHQVRKWSSCALWLTCLAVAILLPKKAWAAPEASCSLSLDQSQAVLGSEVRGTIVFENTGDAIGYGPAVDLFIPAGLTLTDAKTYGASPSRAQVAAPGPQQAVKNPLSGEVVNVPADTAYEQIRVPLSALAPGAPAVEVELTFSVADDARLFIPLNIQAECEYAFGASPENDAAADPPITSAPLDASITPSAITERVEGGGFVCSGPGSQFSWQVKVDVAESVDIQGTHLTADVDDRIVIDSVALVTGSGTVLEDGTGLPILGRTIDVELDPFTGVDGDDVVVEVVAHVPENSAGIGGEPIIDPLTGAAVTITQEFTIGGVTYRDLPTNPFVPLPAMTEEGSVIARSLHLTQEIAPGTAIPGEDFEVRLHVCTSEYFSFSPTELVTVLGDGLSYVDIVSLGVPTVIGDDPTTVTLDLGPLPAGDSQVITYSVVMDETYLSTDPLLGGDRLPVTSDISGQLSSGSFVNYGANGTIGVQGVSYTKTLVAVNGTPPAGLVTVRTGDELTFRLEADVRSGDMGGLVLTDFLPPLFCLPTSMV